MSTVYVKILAGALFGMPRVKTADMSVSIHDIEAAVRYITSIQGEFRIRWSASSAVLDSGQNFDLELFRELLGEHEITYAIEDTTKNGSTISLCGDILTKTTREVVASIESGHDPRDVIHRFEYIPKIVILRTKPVFTPGPREPLHLAIRARTKPINGWRIEATARVLLPPNNYASYASKLISELDGYNNLVKVGVYRYELDHVYDGIPTFADLEEPLMRVIHVGRKIEIKQKNFFHRTHMLYAWTYIKPFIEDRSWVQTIDSAFNSGDLMMRNLFPETIAADSDKILSMINEKTHYLTTHIGESTKIIISNDDKTFVEAMSFEKNVRKLEKPIGKGLYIFDATKVGDIFYINRVMVSENKSFIRSSTKQSFDEVGRLKYIAGDLEKYGVKFEQGVIFSGALPSSGILTYSGGDYFHPRYQINPDGIVLINLLLCKVPRENFNSYNISLPENATIYIAYTTSTYREIMSRPIAHIRQGVWRSRHFGNVRIYGVMPCEFMSAFIPTLHIVPSDTDAYDNKIVACHFDGKWLVPHHIEVGYTEAYRSGVQYYGTKYNEAIATLRKGPPIDFNQPWPYEDLHKGIEAMKAISLGPLLTPTISAIPDRDNFTTIVASPKTYIEIGPLTGADLARIYVSGARMLFLTNGIPDTELEAALLDERYSGSTNAVRWRKTMGIPDPIVGVHANYQSSINIYATNDTALPSSGVAAIGTHPSIRSLCSTNELELVEFVRTSLGKGGLLSILFIDRDEVEALLVHPKTPWKSDNRGIYLAGNLPETVGKVTYSIQRDICERYTITIKSVEQSVRLMGYTNICRQMQSAGMRIRRDSLAIEQEDWREYMTGKKKSSINDVLTVEDAAFLGLLRQMIWKKY